MLLTESTFEDLDLGFPVTPIAEGPDLIPEAAASFVSDLFATEIEAEIPFLRRSVRRWHRNAIDADDLVQDTLMRALASAHQWQPGSSLRAWLLTIMRNQFIDTASRAQRSRAAIELADRCDASVSDNTEVRLVLRDVERAIRRLPEKQRAAVLLTVINEESYADAARAMGLTADAVRCHLARARASLRHVVRWSEEPNLVGTKIAVARL